MSDRAERIHFGTIKEGIEPPNLIEIQLDSYIEFLQTDVPLSVPALRQRPMLEA